LCISNSMDMPVLLRHFITDFPHFSDRFWLPSAAQPV
jgi:hypothetical protein